MSWWTKFGCILTGWNSTVLAQCSEASRSQLSKYTSALLILMIVWSITGFCFAQRYMGLPVWACCIVSLLFVTIVIMIERQILLTNQKSFKLMLFRGIIAAVMAIVGSTIFDQTMFGKDIDKQMANNIELQVADLMGKRVSIIDGKLAYIKAEKDSLERVNAQLQADVNANPWIIQRSATTSQQKLVVDGKIKTVNNLVPDCWIYVQEPDVKLGRIQIFNNWSPYMVEKPEDTVWIGLEYFCNENDKYWNMSDEEFIKFATEELEKMNIIKRQDVLDAHREKVKKAYPAYFDTYSEIDELIKYINEFDNLYCVGRNGQHRYNNMDHSMVTAFEATKNIKKRGTI